MNFTSENRLTIDTLQHMPNMTEQQKEHTYPILAIASELNLLVWYDTERYGLLLGTEKRGPLNLTAPLWVKDDGEAQNVAVMLRLIGDLCGWKPDVSLNERLDAMMDLLEGLVATKSKKGNDKKKPASKKTSKRKPVACQLETRAQPTKTSGGRKLKIELKPSQTDEQNPDTHESKLEELYRRAAAIGNTLIWYEDDSKIRYERPRRKNPQGTLWQTAFTQKDMLKTQLKRPHRQSTWFFSHDELDALEQVIIHDETLYAQLFAD